MRKQFLHILSILIVLISCSFKLPDKVIRVLEKAGNNRIELENVLKHYQNDSLKFKAACFLIENMDIHYSKTQFWLDSLNNRVQFDEFKFIDYKNSVNEFNKKSINGKFKLKTEQFDDIQIINSEYLIYNIDWVSKNLKYYRNLNILDTMVLNYLLPYRIMTEKIETWRNEYNSLFKNYLIKKQNNDIRKTCISLSDTLKGWFFNTYFLNIKNKDLANLSSKQLLFRRQGKCEDMANWAVFILRSLGIASTVDYTPAWATSTGSHYWNVAFDSNGNEVPFFMGDDNPDEFRMIREPAKVIRVLFEKNDNTLAAMVNDSLIPNCYLRNKNYLDVTNRYWRTFDLTCNINDSLKNDNIVYATVLNGAKWKPVWWGKVLNNNVRFSNMTCGVVYLPQKYINNHLEPVSFPFLLNNNGTSQKLKPNNIQRISIIINENEKYIKFKPHIENSLFIWNGRWQKLGTKHAEIETNKLIFKDMPSNGLYVLIPDNSNGLERPFTIDENDKLNWW